MSTPYMLKKIFRHWLTIAFVLGFITDTILLNQIDSLIDNLVLLAYAILATVSLLLLYVGVSERAPRFITRFLKRFTPIVMQYAFGGLLSGMLIFYGRSGDWLTSAPFLLLIVAVVFGNELIAKRSDRLMYHIALYFIGIFSYVVLVVPVLLGRMGDGIFIFSGLISLMIVTAVVQLLYRIIPNFMMVNTRRIIMTIGSIYIGFNVLYFTNIIPPIPLSLTELSIVQSAEKISTGGYRVVYEEQSLLRKLLFTQPLLHPVGDGVACYARVYAPTKLSTNIVHRWEYKDANGVWQEQFHLSYPISGVNKNGYRGYTKLSSVSSGVWRCSVETERGQVLGRKTFVVDTAGVPQKMVTQIE